MSNILDKLIKENYYVESKVLQWKSRQLSDYIITNQGDVFHNSRKLSTWKINGRNYACIVIDGHPWQYRIDYMVAYTFLGTCSDAIRLIHLNEDIADDNLSNLIWYRKVDVLKEYIDLAIIEADGSIKEEWRPCILEYNSTLQLEVSNFGMIRNAVTKELIPLKESHGYRVFYYLDEKFAKQTRIKSVHRAVAEAFIPNPNKYELVNHLDGDQFNDIVYNLEWASSGMNVEHAYLSALNKKVKYTPLQINTVCDLLSRRKISHVQIGYMTGVDRKTISDIYRGRRWKDVSSHYDFRIKKWNDSMKEEVCRLILEGKKGKDIFDQLHMGYDQSAISFYERMRRELKTLGKIA